MYLQTSREAETLFITGTRTATKTLLLKQRNSFSQKFSGQNVKCIFGIVPSQKDKPKKHKESRDIHMNPNKGG